jgi:ABC-type glutathione transport system ATPase component
LRSLPPSWPKSGVKVYRSLKAGGESRIESGRVLLRGESLLDKTERERRAIRGDRVAYIPQDALRALNPTFCAWGHKSGNL